MRIALISTPFVPVPPPAYGGTELIVSELFDGLRAAGHHVRLYTCGGTAQAGRGHRTDHEPTGTTAIGGERRVLFHQPAWPPDPWLELCHTAWAARDLASPPPGEPPFDVVHAHCPSSLPLGPIHRGAMVYTVHHARDEALSALYARSASMQEPRFVCVSARQRELLPEASAASVVHHGLDERRHPLGAGGGPALFLGRLSAEKGPHVAIDVARRAGCPIVLAGRPHPDDADYFEAQVRPRLRLPGVRWLGEVDSARKRPLLASARALLFPIDWEEPFGLVMIEAMLSGTPVLALPRGSVPEVIDDGVTGHVCGSAAEMTERLAGLDGTGGQPRFDRANCRRRAVERFGRARMVERYLEVYAEAVASSQGQGQGQGSPRPRAETCAASGTTSVAGLSGNGRAG